MVFRVFIFIFLFRTNAQKEHLGGNNFCHCYGIFFGSVVLNVTWSQLCSKFFLNNYEAYWQQHLTDNLPLKILRKWIKIGANWLWINLRAKHTFNKILSWLNIMKGKLTKVSGKLSVAQKSKPVHQITLRRNRRWHFTYCCMVLFLSKNLAFKFNLMLIK